MSLHEEENFSVQIVETSPSCRLNQMKVVRGRVTPVAMLKFELPFLFDELDKLLYIDSDVLINADLGDFFATDISRVYAAVVKDILTYTNPNHMRWLETKLTTYFNSGVMLLNLELMRSHGLPEKLMDYRMYGRNAFTDQDTLNVVFNGNVKYVSPYYNLLNCFFDWKPMERLESIYDTNFLSNKEET